MKKLIYILLLIPAVIYSQPDNPGSTTRQLFQMAMPVQD